MVDADTIDFCKHYKITFGYLSDEMKLRSKRTIDKKKYQGQTQTQFISFGSQNQNEKNGIAEAVSQPDISRATVSKFLSTDIL